MKVVIVDDERLARQEMRQLLEDYPARTIVAEASNIAEARAAVEQFEPDLIFLDIRMPGGSGFDLLDRLDRLPEVIFTTAYDEYAVRAFETSALDYLLKPIEPDRLAAAMEKLLARSRFVDRHTDRLGEDDRIFVRDGDRCWLVRVGDVRLFESEGNYTRLIFEEARPLVLRSLKSLEDRLDPETFFRVNRRQIVNLKRVARIRASSSGGSFLTELDSGEEVEVSRRRTRELRTLLRL